MSIRLGLLPIDLLCLPLMLAFLAFAPLGYAFLGLAMCVGVLLGLGSREERHYMHRTSLLLLVAHSVLFYLSYLVLEAWINTRLGLQLLWMVWFLIGQFTSYVRYRGGMGLRGTSEELCSCSLLRRKVMLAEYRRFHTILIWSAVITLTIALPLELLFGSQRILSICISSTLALSALATVILELTHLSWVSRRLEGEHWLPVIRDDGSIISRVPLTMPRTTAGRLPIVRLVAYSEGMIYLEQTPQLLSSTHPYDTPFMQFLSEDETAQATAQKMIDERFCGIKRALPRQLLSYYHEEDNQPLIVYLFVVEVPQPDLLQIDCRPIEGKWWCINQLKPMITQSDFSSYLTAELPLLEQTVLLAQQLKERQTGIASTACS